MTDIQGKIIKADSDGNWFYVGEFEVVPFEGYKESYYPIPVRADESAIVFVKNQIEDNKTCSRCGK